MKKQEIFLIILGLFSLISAIRIYQIADEHSTLSVAVESLEIDPLPGLEATLLDKQSVSNGIGVRSLFTFGTVLVPLPPLPPPPPKKPVQTSYLDALNGLTRQFKNAFNSVKIPVMPLPDLKAIRFRGLLRKHGNTFAILRVKDKTRLLGPGEEVIPGVIVSSCDFHRRKLTLKVGVSGQTHELTAER